MKDTLPQFYIYDAEHPSKHVRFDVTENALFNSKIVCLIHQFAFVED